MFPINAMFMLRLATKLYPLVNTLVVWNAVQSVSGGVSSVVDRILTPQASVQSRLFQTLANHAISVPFRMVGGMIRPLGRLFRRSQVEPTTSLDIFNIRKIGDAYTVFTSPEFYTLASAILLKLTILVVFAVVLYFLNKWAYDRLNDHIELTIFRKEKEKREKEENELQSQNENSNTPDKSKNNDNNTNLIPIG